MATHGLYAKAHKPTLQLRSRAVERLMKEKLAACPWIEPQDYPLLRRWAELDYHARRMHAFLRITGEINSAGDPRRLLSELRMFALAQATLSDRLGLTPLSRPAAKAASEKNKAIDIAEFFADEIDAERKAELKKAKATAADTTEVEPIEAEKKAKEGKDDE